MKFTSLENLTYFWSKVKAYADGITTTLTNSISALTKSDVGLGNVDNTADADKPVSTATQTALDAKQDTLVSGTNIKTINNTSLLGSGNITIDLTLYKVVTSLPTSGIDTNKIYLVLSTESGTSNKYIEYIYVNSAWEKVGEYQAEVDLSDYATTAAMETALAEKADASDTYTKSEVDAKITASGTFDSTQYYTKTEVDAKETTLTEAVEKKGGYLATAYGSSNAAIYLYDAYNSDTSTMELLSSTSVKAATTSTAGVMSATDKTKLDGVATGATADEALTESEIDAICV